jgi:hypothetical protein
MKDAGLPQTISALLLDYTASNSGRQCAIKGTILEINNRSHDEESTAVSSTII